jgi:CRISPR-associated endonuclease Csn1
MNKIFALDLGTNSIGWALRNPDLQENQIEKFGVITFNKGVGLGKTGEYSYAAERTKKRSTRRLYQARKYRLWSTLEHLINEGYCPLKIENLNGWRYYSKEEAQKNNNGGRVYPVDDLVFDAWIKLDFNNDGKPDYTSPYQLRKELAEVKFDLTKEENRFKLGRALYHIAQRRGFKSSRKGSDDNKEKETANENDIVDLQYSEKKKNKVIVELFQKYPEAKTIGALFANLENDGIRIRESIAQYAIRENFKDEIKHIFQIQGLLFTDPLYSKLVETGKNKNDGSIFYKRPLRSQKGLIGKCTLEPNKYRAPISHPSFEIFRAWSFLNNIKFKQSDGNDEGWKPLDLDLKKKIYNKLFFRKKAYFPFSDIEDLLKKEGKNWQLNYKSRTTVTGCPLSARLKDIFGDNYLFVQIPKSPSPKAKKNFYNIEDIWHVLFSFEDQEYVEEFAATKLKLDDEKVKQFIIAWNATPVGYAMLSLHAINKINTFLQKGLIYTEAVLLANIPEIIGKDVWSKNEALLINEISKVIDENRSQKTILTIVNSLISKHKNLADHEKFGFKDNNYKLDSSDFTAIEETIKDQFGEKKWVTKPEDEQKQISNTVRDCYQAYFINTGLERKDIHNERHFAVKSNNKIYYKSDSGYFRLPKLIDTLAEFLQLNFTVSDEKLKKIYHPSEINIYPPAKPDKEGVLKLGSPKTGSFKNPMAMRALHELRKLINFMIETNQIDSDTRIVVEVARELNDSNKRWAIEAWQKQRESENNEFALAIEQLLKEEQGVSADSKSSVDIDKFRLWYEQGEEESVPPIAEGKKDVKGIKWSENKKNSYKEIAAKKEMLDKYRLWKEQNCQCFYTGRIIKITDLFKENVIDFEHTIPRSLSFDNSLANLTVCYADFNRTVKKNQIPFNLNNYNEILPRLKNWQEKVERIKQQIDFWNTKSKKAADKSWKDDAIRQRHLWQMELDYWRNKVDRFTMEEVTSGFKNSQKVDTQLISKYAFHYLKTYFDRVDVQKGSITAEFRKIYGLQIPDAKKDRSKHSHHAKDAAVLTLIPIAAKRDEILKTYYEHQERRKTFSTEPYKGFKREFVWNIDDSVLINNIAIDQSLTPAKRIVRKRGKVQFIEGTNKPKIATGDNIRGQLHLDTFYGAIRPAKRGEKGEILRDENDKIVQEETVKYVLRVPFQFKSKPELPGFKTLEEIETQLVDPGLKKQIVSQVNEAGGVKEAFEKGIYMLDRKGNKVNKIRHVRIFQDVKEPLQIKKQTNLSKHNYKHFYYANNASNIAYGLYRNHDNSKSSFKIINLFTASKISKLTGSRKIELENEIIIGKNALKLYSILQPDQKVIFYKENISELKNLLFEELSSRIYKIEGFEKDGRIRFMHHLNAAPDNELKKLENQFGKGIYQGYSTLNYENPWPKLKLSLSNLMMAIENRDFKVGMDGTIQWL